MVKDNDFARLDLCQIMETVFFNKSMLKINYRLFPVRRTFRFLPKTHIDNHISWDIHLGGIRGNAVVL